MYSQPEKEEDLKIRKEYHRNNKERGEDKGARDRQRESKKKRERERERERERKENERERVKQKRKNLGQIF